MEDLPYTYNVILLYENTMLFFSKKNFSGVKDTTFRDLDLWPQWTYFKLYSFLKSVGKDGELST